MFDVLLRAGCGEKRAGLDFLRRWVFEMRAIWLIGKEIEVFWKECYRLPSMFMLVQN